MAVMTPPLRHMLILILYLLRNAESWHMLSFGLVPYNPDVPV